MSRRQQLAFHRPSERLRHCGIEVADEAFDPLLEMLLGREVAAAEEFADQDREPDLDLVEPRGVFRREVEGNAVSSIAQEALACRHRLKDAGFPLLAEVFVDAAEISNKAGDAFGHVRVEVVADHPPARRRRWRTDCPGMPRNRPRCGYTR